MAAFLYEFEWDAVKAQTNFNKHGLDLSGQTTVFLDPLALTIPDEEHSETEAMDYAKDATDHYVLVVHTFEPLTDDRARIRLISARRPIRGEVHNYEERDEARI